MDVRETGSEESGPTRGRKQQGVCVCACVGLRGKIQRQKKGGAPSVVVSLLVVLICWVKKKLKVKEKKTNHTDENIFSNLTPSDIADSRKGQPVPEKL